MFVNTIINSQMEAEAEAVQYFFHKMEAEAEAIQFFFVKMEAEAEAPSKSTSSNSLVESAKKGPYQLIKLLIKNLQINWLAKRNQKIWVTLWMILMRHWL